MKLYELLGTIDFRKDKELKPILFVRENATVLYLSDRALFQEYDLFPLLSREVSRYLDYRFLEKFRYIDVFLKPIQDTL